MARAPSPTQELGQLTSHIATLGKSITTQGVGTVVPTFEGDQKEFKNWVKAIEKYCLLTDLDEGRKRNIALQTAKGSVSDFLLRYIRQHPNGDWETLKKELNDRFGDIVDKAHARAILKNMKQKKMESPQMFCERLLSASEDAFDKTDRQPDGELLPGIEKILIDFFVDGLWESTIKLKIMRENPTSMRRAVEIANQEQNLKARYQLRVGAKPHFSDDANIINPTPLRRDEPMEVDASRLKGVGACYKCGRKGHRASQCRGPSHSRQVNAVQDIVCWKCNKRGHMRYQCTSQ